MPTLPNELRNKLERVVIDARDAAEIGARAALEALAVHHHAPYPHMKPAQSELRNHLRARARQLGDRKLPKPDARARTTRLTTWPASAPTNTGIGCSSPGSWPRTVC